MSKEKNIVLTEEQQAANREAMQGLIENPTRNQILRFIIPSAIGVFIFLCPIWAGGNMTIPLGVISNWLAGFTGAAAKQLVFTVVSISCVMSLICTLRKPGFARNEDGLMHSLFVTTPVFLVIRCLGCVVASMLMFGIGPEWIRSADTGGTMQSLMGTLIAWFFAASFLIPLLLEYGIMDYVGTLVRGALRPLFRLPGRAAVDLLASWIGNCNVGVVLTSTQYEEGYYTARESVLIASCFSAVSLPFCLVVAAMLKVDQYFLQFYGILCLVGVLSVVIMCRIWPLNGKYKDEYYAPVGQRINEIEPKGIKKTHWAFAQAVTKAQSGPTFAELMKKGISMFLNILFTLVPVTMCVGTFALILSTYTPVFDWIGTPFRYYFQLLGVPEAAAAAPGAVVGFADQFVPCIICANIVSVKTRFIIGILSLVQIIYMSEVGSIMIASKMPVNIVDLIIIFLEKTIIAIPLIVLFTNLFMNF